MIENRMVVLDALRGFAAVAVALVHFTIGMNSSWFQRVCHWGWLGVDVFFVISGFVIPLALARARYCFPSGYLPFLAKRLVRLHPPYLAVVILLIGVSALHTPSTFRGITEIFISHALLLNGFLEKPWLSGIFWSLAIEMQFYLFVGIAAPLLLRNRIQASLMILIFLSIAFLPVPKTFLFPHLPLFCFGILGFLQHRGIIGNRIFWLGLLLSGVVCCIVMGKPQALVGATTALLICHWKWSIPSCLVALGTVSYSLYLLHSLIGEAIIPLLEDGRSNGFLSQIMVTACALAISIAAAWIWFRLIEAPSQRLSSSIRYGIGQKPRAAKDP